LKKFLCMRIFIQGCKNLQRQNKNNKMTNIIEIKNVSKTFKNSQGKKVKALDNISLNIKKGEIFGLLGANGAGKTTLISIMLGVLSKDSGTISIFNKDLETNLDYIKPKINIVSGFSMVGSILNTREYLNYFAMLYDVKNKKAKVDYAVKMLRLENKEKMQVKDLSSGYKQRVLLAKALLNDPEIIFMDEPTVGLDVSIAIKIRDLIEKLKKKGTTIIFTSHNLNEVEQLCDNITLISNGKILQSGTINEIKKRIRDNKILEVMCKRSDELIKIIKKYNEVKNVNKVNNKIIIKIKEENKVDLVMKKIMNSNFIIFSIRKIEPTLEEAFLNIVNGEKS
jgi:ABC-type multidrug transport system ATPase subunit